MFNNLKLDELVDKTVYSMGNLNEDAMDEMLKDVCLDRIKDAYGVVKYTHSLTRK